jgi:hypothetical protein
MASIGSGTIDAGQLATLVAAVSSAATGVEQVTAPLDALLATLQTQQAAYTTAAQALATYAGTLP